MLRITSDNFQCPVERNDAVGDNITNPKRQTWHANIKQYLSWWVFEARGRVPSTTSASTSAVSGGIEKPSTAVVSCEPLRSQIHTVRGLPDATVLTIEELEEEQEEQEEQQEVKPSHSHNALDSVSLDVWSGSTTTLEPKPGDMRQVVFDGPNVAWARGVPHNFSVKRLVIA